MPWNNMHKLEPTDDKPSELRIQIRLFFTVLDERIMGWVDRTLENQKAAAVALAMTMAVGLALLIYALSH